jgi:hypothetical protein
MKRIGKSAVIALGALGMIAGASASARAATCGDLNNSGGVTPRTIADVVLLFRAVLEEPDPSPLCGGAGVLDCGNVIANPSDGATQIKINDVVALFNSVLGNETLFELCEGEGNEIACPGGQAVITSDVTTNQVWPAGCDIEIDGLTFVASDAVLTIRAGATIQGRKVTSDPPSALVFRPGTKINAVGTSGSPIIMTSDQAPGARLAGDWGGLTLLGRGPVNCEDDVCDAEGLEGVTFGGTETNDSSGILRFARIEFSGRLLTIDNELNVLTMNGLGRGTTIDHVQANIGLDDGLEWFGGNVNTSFMLSTGAADDQIDWQIGHTGAHQFLAGIQNGANLDTAGSHGYEADNNEDVHTATPISAPRFCNVTLVGARGQGGGNVDARGALLRRGTKGKLSHQVVVNWNTSALQMRDQATLNGACVNTTTLTGETLVQNSVFFGNAALAANHSSCDAPGECNCTTTEFFGLQVGNVTDESCNPIDASSTCDPTFGGGNGQCLPTPARACVGGKPTNCSSIDPTFTNTSYAGAFAPGAGADWASGAWVSLASN